MVKGGEKVEKEMSVAAQETLDENGAAEDDGFGGFDEEEDRKYMDKANRNAMRRRGFDPRSKKKQANGKNASRS
jgi:ribosomal RNA methyltransferase Nop2